VGSNRFLAYHQLGTSLAALRKHHGRKRRTNPNDDDLRHGDALLVASHAAIEHYLEELCRRGIYNSLRRYVQRGVMSPILSALLETHHWSIVAAVPVGDVQYASMDERVGKAIKWYVSAKLQKNHGIKEKNLFGLFLPLGLDVSYFDPLWINEMNTLGQARGDVAHGKPPAIDAPLDVTVNGRMITVWPAQLRTGRPKLPPWEVESTLGNLTPELAALDRKIARMCLSLK
jgi:hypothetical protein